MTPKIEGALRLCLNTFASWFQEEILGALKAAGLSYPEELRAVAAQIEKPTPALLKRAVIFARPVRVRELEERAKIP